MEKEKTWVDCKDCRFCVVDTIYGCKLCIYIDVKTNERMYLGLPTFVCPKKEKK